MTADFGIIVKPKDVSSYQVTIIDSGDDYSGNGEYDAGSEVILYAGIKDGYLFDHWSYEDIEITDPTEELLFFTMPEGDVSLTAHWRLIRSSSGSSRRDPDPVVEQGSIMSNQDDTPGVDKRVELSYTASGGIATIYIYEDKVAEVVHQGNGERAIIDVRSIMDIAVAQLTVEALEGFGKSGLGVELRFAQGTLILDEDVLASLVEQTKSENLTLEIEMVDLGELNSAQQGVIGSNDVLVDINLFSEGEKISTFDGHITVQLPYYGPLPVAVWYLNDEGELEKLSCNFEDGVVSFDLEHISLYVVGPDKDWSNPFTDVKTTDWFYEAVQYVYEKGLMVGTAAEPMTFGPHEVLPGGCW